MACRQVQAFVLSLDLPAWYEKSIHAWLTRLNAQGYAANTLGNYEHCIKSFAKFLATQGINDWSDCKKSHLQSYLAHAQDEQNISTKTLKLHLSALRLFFDYLVEQAVMTHNPTIGLRLKSSPQKLPNLVDYHTITALLDQAIPTNPKQKALWLRDKAIFELCYSCGLRVSELVGIDMDDIDFDERLLWVLGKGSKMRKLPVGRQALYALKDYLPLRHAWAKCPALFVSQSGKRLSVRAVQLRLEAMTQKAGIDRHLHPHLLRHAFASHMLSNSGDLRATQELLGHSHLSTTQIYTHLDFVSLSDLYDKAHPRAAKK